MNVFPREEKVKKTAEIMSKGLRNFAKQFGVPPTKVQIVIEPVGPQIEPKYRVMCELKDTGPADENGKPTIKYATFREILGHIDFLGFSQLAAGFFREAFLAYATALVNAGMKDAHPARVKFMISTEKEDASVPYMHLYVDFKCIQQITFDEIFPPEN